MIDLDLFSSLVGTSMLFRRSWYFSINSRSSLQFIGLLVNRSYLGLLALKSPARIVHLVIIYGQDSLVIALIAIPCSGLILWLYILTSLVIYAFFSLCLSHTSRHCVQVSFTRSILYSITQELRISLLTTVTTLIVFFSLASGQKKVKLG